MTKNKGRFRPFTFRLSSADWSGIFGQCANWLTESTALIDNQRLKRYFAAYWALSSPVLEIAWSPDRLPVEIQTELQVQKDPEGSSTCVKIVHQCPDRPIVSRHCTRDQIRHWSQEQCAGPLRFVRGVPLFSAPPNWWATFRARWLHWTISFPAIGGCMRQA